MELSNICEYSSKRIDSSLLTVENYVSTENMMQNKGGITLAAKVPVENSVEFLPGDILISNIRPYFRKIWLSDKKGGCSSDVLCIRALPGTDSAYLYYLLSQDSFFDYVMSGAKGCKMPRGDKSQIMQWDVDLPNFEEQHRIASILKSIDDKIQLNNQINHNLEEQAQIVFDRIFNSDLTNNCLLSSIVDINPKRTLRKNEVARCIDMTYLNTFGSFPSGWEFKPYSGGMKFINGDTLMARITPCLENGKVAYINFLDKEETAFGSTEYIVFHAKEGYPNEMFYFLTRNKAFIEFATKNMNGSSGRQRVSGETIGNYIIPVLSEDDIHELKTVSESTMKEILKNNLESRVLSEMRNTILPKLMSGELKISDLTC